MFLSRNKEKHNNLLKFNIHNLWSECSIFRHLIYRNTVLPEAYTNIQKKNYISAILKWWKFDSNEMFLNTPVIIIIFAISS